MPHVKIWDDQISYTVTGRGAFPMDMLRREEAWPHGSDDAAAITGRGRRSITLTARRARHCVPDRWASFGWEVHNADQFPYGEHVLQRARNNPLAVNNSHLINPFAY